MGPLVYYFFKHRLHDPSLNLRLLFLCTAAPIFGCCLMIASALAFVQEAAAQNEVPAVPRADDPGLGQESCAGELEAEKRRFAANQRRFESCQKNMFECDQKLEVLQRECNRRPSEDLGGLKDALTKALGELDSKIGALERSNKRAGE